MPLLPHALYLASQVRAAELALSEQTNTPLYDLVEHAGAAAYQILQSLSLGNVRYLVLAGGGNNGADALVLARYLRNHGADVQMMTLAKHEYSVEYLAAKKVFIDNGGVCLSLDPQEFHAADVIIDGLLGTGIHLDAIRLGLTTELCAIVNAINQSSAMVVSLDIPSGIHADTGRCAPVAVNATHTIVFGAMKQGLLTSRARHCCGTLHFADIGLSAFLPSPSAQWVDESYLKERLLPRARDCHKGDNGKVAIVGGDLGMPGSIRLASEACLRAGAGLVAVVSQPEHLSVVVGSRPEVMFTSTFCELSDQSDDHTALPISERVQHLLKWADVIVLGPGLGTRRWGEALFATVLNEIKGEASDNSALDTNSRKGLVPPPLVVDADGLNLLSQQPQHYPHWILTPHPAEAARLLGVDTEQIEQNRFAAVKALQQKYGGVVLLKGAGTLITDGAQCIVAPVGNPGLASAGCGDVLSGIIGALLGQGLDKMQAAIAGVVIHGCAADDAAKLGERGMLASDLMRHIRHWVNL